MDYVFIRRPKRFLRAMLICEYDHYPAVRVKLRGLETIMGKDEVITSEQMGELRFKQEQDEARTQHASLIKRWTPGMTWEKWRDSGGEYWLWSAVQRLKRLKIIPET